MNNYFILSLVSFLSAIIIVALKVCYASKCAKIQVCWGMVSVSRETQQENRELHDSELNLNTTPDIRQMQNLKNIQVEVPDGVARV